LFCESEMVQVVRAGRFQRSALFSGMDSNISHSNECIICILIPVVLENGTEGRPEYRRRCQESVTVQAWPFEQMMQDHLLDPFLFGNKDNLVNGDNP
jgi:hypothetical protein